MLFFILNTNSLKLKQKKRFGLSKVHKSKGSALFIVYV